MTDTRHYHRETVLRAARDLARRRAVGEINHLEYALELNTYRLRASNGAYWFLDPGTERWYCFEHGQWSARQAAPEALEGPNLLSFLAASGAHVVPVPEPVEPRGLTAAEALAAIVDELRRGFGRGTLSSSDARGLLARQVLVDLDGVFWTQGFRSGRWYGFQDGRWHRQDNPPPADDRLFHMEAGQRRCRVCRTVVSDGMTCPACGGDVVLMMEAPPEAVARALPAFLLFGVTMLPESVTDPWEPPLSFPDEVINGGHQRPPGTVAPPTEDLRHQPAPSWQRCPACGTALQAGQSFCAQCGVRTEGFAPRR